jgi:lipopolysaccharide biosynthesis glycosyltransferase
MHERFDIAVLHYTGHAKPWKLFARVAFFRLYRHVMTNDLYYRYMRHRVRGRLARMVPFLKK